MKCKYSITFEFEISQPITVKGNAQGTSIRTVAARAIDDAVKQNPKSKWSSIVILIERELKEVESEIEEEGVDNNE